MDNSAQGHPMFTNDEHVQQAAEIKRLQDIIITGQRLVTRLQGEKAAAQANERRLLEQNTAMWRMLRAVRRHWTFRFLPWDLKNTIKEEAGNAN